MKSVVTFILCTICFIVNSLAQSQPTSNDTTIVYDVSMIQLIATPEKYHGRYIQVVGYLNLEFEGDAIYLHKEDFQNSLSLNAFWVEFSTRIQREKKLADYSKKYVIVIGRFDMYSKGHLSSFGGKIKNITRLDNWITGR